MSWVRKAAKKAADKAEDVVLGKSEKDIQSVDEGRKQDKGKGATL